MKKKKELEKVEKEYNELKNNLKNSSIFEKRKKEKEFDELLDKYFALKKYFEKVSIFGPSL